MAKDVVPVESLGKLVETRGPDTGTAIVGRLGDGVGKEYVIRGPDGSGAEVEWVVKPTGRNSFELTVPKGHELGTPDAWEGVSIMTQRVVAGADNCGCDGNQCGCQGQNCGSNCNSAAGNIRLADRAIGTLINPQTLEALRRTF